MKTINLLLILLFTSFYALSSFSSEISGYLTSKYNYTDTTFISSDPNPFKQEATVILSLRLEEINNMDKSGMTEREIKNLQVEVKSIEAKQNTSSLGVYLSVAVILLFIIILMALL